MAQTNPLRRDRVQNEVKLEATKDAAIETTRFMLASANQTE